MPDLTTARAAEAEARQALLNEIADEMHGGPPNRDSRVWDLVDALVTAVEARVRAEVAHARVNAELAHIRSYLHPTLTPAPSPAPLSGDAHDA